MTDSFGTITFTALADGMDRAQVAEVAITHIPGGNVNYFDYSGRTPLELSYNLLLTGANYRALEGVVGGTAKLTTVVDGTISCAALLTLQRKGRVPVSGTTFAAASFVVVTA
jgi:hypothetical protein